MLDKLKKFFSCTATSKAKSKVQVSQPTKTTSLLLEDFLKGSFTTEETDMPDIMTMDEPTPRFDKSHYQDSSCTFTCCLFKKDKVDVGYKFGPEPVGTELKDYKDNDEDQDHPYNEIPNL